MIKNLKGKGFTLVELAIVLVIIGILLAAVLKGQEMINNAKIKAVANQYKSLVGAIYSYQDKYGQLPGDDNNATNHLSGSGCSVSNGDGNGRIEGAIEPFAAPEHLACAGFITGDYNGTSDYIKHTYGGNVEIVYDSFSGKEGHFIKFYDLKAKDAEAVDRLIDDGVYNRGSCRADASYSPGTVVTLGCLF